MQLLTITVDPGPPRTLRVRGEVDMASAGELRVALEAALDEASHLVVDLGDVTFIDAAGLRALIGPAQSLNGRGPLRLVNADRVARLFTVLHPDGVPSIAFDAKA
jgi:anti-anti-sigma factor